MILTGPEIQRQVAKGRIQIDGFDPANLGPNSYDLTLKNYFRCYSVRELDMKGKNPTKTFPIPEYGEILEPGMLYLMGTAEQIGSKYYVPIIDTRSSVGRLGISAQMAGFGDLGFYGSFTLHVTVVKPIRIYPNVRICQVYWLQAKGCRTMYAGKYQHQSGIIASQMYEDKEFVNGPRHEEPQKGIKRFFNFRRCGWLWKNNTTPPTG